MPFFLPDYTFIIPDMTEASRRRAKELADYLADQNDQVYAAEFLLPIRDALLSLLGLDWNTDQVDPDLMTSLEAWYVSEFDEYALGRAARKAANELRSLYDYALVYIDATPKHIQAFLDLPHSRMCFVHLSPGAMTPIINTLTSHNIFATPSDTIPQLAIHISETTTS